MTGIQINKEQDQDEEEQEPLNIKVPDVSGLLQKLDGEIIECLQAEHQEMESAQDEDLSEEQKKDAAQKRAARQRRMGQICCCHVPGCRIGPMEMI